MLRIKIPAKKVTIDDRVAQLEKLVQKQNSEITAIKKSLGKKEVK